MGVIGAVIKIGSWRGTFGKDKRVSLTLQLETDDVADGPMAIYASPLVPKVGEYYAVGNEASTGYFCKSVKPKIDDKDKCFWEVDVEYEGAELPADEEEGNEEDARPSRRYQFDSMIRYEKVPIYRDMDDKHVVNTAGELFSRPVEVNRKILVFNISRKEFTNPFPRQTKYQDAVNSDTFWGQAPGKVLIESYLMDGEAMENRTAGWNVKYSIAIRPSNDSAGVWDELEIPSMGCNEKIESGLREIINPATGKAFSTEQYLDENGKWKDRLAPDFEPYMQKFRIRNKYSFAPLRLPDLTNAIYSAMLEDFS